jgi:hypothetical protein
MNKIMENMSVYPQLQDMLGSLTLAEVAARTSISEERLKLLNSSFSVQANADEHKAVVFAWLRWKGEPCQKNKS